MRSFDYRKPSTVEEAVAVLSEHGPNARCLAGGTDLLVHMRGRRLEPEVVVDIKGIDELNALTYAAGEGLWLGAAVPCYRIYKDDAVKEHYPALADTAGIIGGTLIQGRASVGGNLCNAAPSADTIPLLIALGGVAEIAGASGRRSVPVEDFCTAPGKNVLAVGELLAGVRLPDPQPHSGAHYLRFIPRNEMDIAVAGVGVSVVVENGKFAGARLALASVAPTPLLVPAAGEALEGQPVSDESIAAAAQKAQEAVSPISDMRGTAEFRRHLCGVLTRRALNAAVDAARVN